MGGTHCSSQVSCVVQNVEGIGSKNTVPYNWGPKWIDWNNLEID